MKAKSFIAILLLMAASAQTASAQKVIIYHSNAPATELKASAIDSIVFVPEASMPSYLSCPDNHHPHAIDLGLPSGTKWCCCNVGATAPESFGGYYAWGETSTKEVYERNSYAHFQTENGTKYIDIGTDIAGTSYDVAHVLMGAPWRMPSVDMVKELVENCTYQWTKLNDVDGILVTGSNGGEIFLPAASGIWGTNINNLGKAGGYWTSVDYRDYAEYACCLSFNAKPNIWSWESHTSRYAGYTVRAVRP